MKNKLTLLISVIAISIQAQYHIGLIPRVSPTTTITNTIGYTEVGIKYSSPSVNNRKIWGDLVPYNKVWRAGANEATQVTFSKTVVIGEKEIPAGKYALFIIPSEYNAWTVILSSNASQWGAFNYTPSEDVLRMDVLPRFNVNYVEKLRFEIIDIGFEYGILRMQWENVELEIEFMTNFIENFHHQIEQTADTLSQENSWAVYLQGAEFLSNRKQDTSQAMEWIRQAEHYYLSHGVQKWNKKEYFLGHIYWVKANLLTQQNLYPEALELIKKIKNDAEKGYYTGNRKAKIDQLEMALLDK